MPIIDAKTETPCGWGVFTDGFPVCPINPAPYGANPTDKKCPAFDVEACSRAWGEHAYCPRQAINGSYGKHAQQREGRNRRGLC